MARYKQATADGLWVIDSTDGAMLPTQGNWRSDEYQAWLTAGNEPDPFPVPTF